MVQNLSSDGSGMRMKDGGKDALFKFRSGFFFLTIPREGGAEALR